MKIKTQKNSLIGSEGLKKQTKKCYFDWRIFKTQAGLQKDRYQRYLVRFNPISQGGGVSDTPP